MANEQFITVAEIVAAWRAMDEAEKLVRIAQALRDMDERAERTSPDA